MEGQTELEKMECGPGPSRVEETRKKVEKMAVDETEQASGILRNMAGKAREGWLRMRRMLDGKKLVWKGSTGRMVAVEKDKEGDSGEKESLNLEEELVGGTVEIIREERGTEMSREDDRRSTIGMDERGGWAEMDFLDKIEPEERDEELEAKMGEDKKRKRGEDDFKGKGTGLKGLPGWERKSNAVKDSERWKRKVVRVEKTAEGEFVRKESVEKIPTPDGFDLGR
jgi:hypothetical protein